MTESGFGGLGHYSDQQSVVSLGENGMRNAVTNLMTKFTNRFNLLLLASAIYFVVLILYDLIFLKRPFLNIRNEYLVIAFVGSILWLGIKLIFWVLIVNGETGWFLDVYFFMFFFVFCFGIIVVSIDYFVNGFSIAPYMNIIAFLSGIKSYKLYWPN